MIHLQGAKQFNRDSKFKSLEIDHFCAVCTLFMSFSPCFGISLSLECEYYVTRETSNPAITHSLMNYSSLTSIDIVEWKTLRLYGK